MKTSDYERETEKFVKYPLNHELWYLTLGLSSEAGEVADKVKKFLRDGELSDGDVAQELGDVLFYLTRLAILFGLSVEDLAELNHTKLASRLDRGKLHGSGDNR